MSYARTLSRYPALLIAVALFSFAILGLDASPAGATVPANGDIYVDDTFAGTEGIACTVDTINYDACYNTIQEAENSTSNPTVHVDDGTYNENVTVNNPSGATITSIDGAATTIVQSAVVDTPIFAVDTDEVTIDGFTIKQDDPGPAASPHIGNSGVMIDGSVVGPDSVVIENNIFLGTDTDEAILVNPAIEGGHLVIQNNDFGRTGAAVNYGFLDLIHFHYTTYGAPLNDDLAALSANIEILGNDGLEYGQSAVYFHADVFMTTITIDDNDFEDSTGALGTTYGVYFSDDIRSFSSVSVTDTEVADNDYGIYVASDVINRSSLTLGTFETVNHEDYGLYIGSDVEHQSALSVVDSTLDGDDNADYGIYVGGHLADAQSMAVISNTDITDVDYAGIYSDSGVNQLSNALIQDVDITLEDNGGSTYGIYVDEVDAGSTLSIDPTTITGFTYAGIYVSSGTDDGSVLNIDDVTMTTDNDGAEYCIYLEENSYGSTVNVRNNTCLGIGGPNAGTGYAYYESSGTYYQSETTVTGNDFTAHDDGMGYGAYVYEVLDNSTHTFSGNTIIGATSYGFYLSDYVEDNSDQFIDNNTFTADDSASSAYGVYHEGTYYGGEVHITNNDITGFDYAGIYYYENEYNGYGNIDGNTITAPQDGSEYGIYFEYNYYESTQKINNNTVTGVGGPNSGTGHGIYIDYGVYEAGIFEAIGNDITAHSDGMDYGFYIYSYLTEEDGAATVSDNTFDGFDYAGIYYVNVYSGGTATLDNNTLIAHADGAEYGIYTSTTEYGSTVVFSNNDVSGFGGPNSGTGYGYYHGSGADYGSTVTLDGNTFTSHPDGADYGYYDDSGADNGSTLNIVNNTFAGSDVYGLDTEGADNGSWVTIDDNIIVGKGCSAAMPYGCLVGSDGFEYGINIYYASEYGGEANIRNNVVSGHGGVGSSTGYGLYMSYGPYDGGTLRIEGNDFLGHQDGPDYAMYVDNYLVEYGGDVYITDNTFTNFDYAGLYLNYMEEGTAWINNNTVTAHPFGAEYGFYWDSIYYAAEIHQTGNVVSGFGGNNASTGYGYYIYDIYDAASLDIDDDQYLGNTGVAVQPDYCVYIEDDFSPAVTVSFDNSTCTNFDYAGLYVDVEIEDGSFLNVRDSTFTGHPIDPAYYGIYLDDYVDYGSVATLTGNNISNFTEYGIYADYFDDTSDGFINDNTLTAHSTFEDGYYGIYHGGSEYGGTQEINDNVITGVKGGSSYGIYSAGSYTGAVHELCGNSITAGTGGVEYGILLDYAGYEGGTSEICNNTVTGFTYSGIEIRSGNYSGDAAIVGNTLNAHSGGADFGISWDSDLYDGMTVDISSNLINGVDGDAGIYVYEAETGSTVNVSNNTLNLDDADRGVEIGPISDGSEVNITQNEITDFDEDGISFDSEIWGSMVLVQNNILDGSGTDQGIDFDSAISFGAIVRVLNNCLYDVPSGVQVNELLDTAQMHINQNDLADMATAIDATGVTNEVDGENNWYGGAAGPNTVTTSDTLGNVDEAPHLASAPSCAGATATPTPTASPTPTPTGTSTATSTGTATATPSPTASPTPVSTGQTPRPTRTPAFTSSPTPINTSQPQVTDPATPTPTQTPGPTAAPTPLGTGPTVRPTRTPAP